MKLRVASDLHLEWRIRPNEDPDVALPTVLGHLLPADELDFESVLLLAGDISSYPAQRLALLKTLVPRFKHVFYVAGNHEFYGGDIASWETERKLMKQTFGDKLTVSEVSLCEAYVSDCGVRIYGCTLWARFGTESPLKEMQVSGMSDFMLIKQGGTVFTPRRGARLHELEQRALQACLDGEATGNKLVVVTHYLPSFSLCDPKFGHTLDGAFASNQDAILSSENAPELWIHGHTHEAIDRFIGNSRVICNPAGYPLEGHTGYRDRLFIDV